MLIPGELIAYGFPIFGVKRRGWRWGSISSLWKVAMLIPGELIAYGFPFWKRGIEGDLQSFDRRFR